jgi:hypothetical protein
MKWFDLAPPWAREMFTVLMSRLDKLDTEETSLMTAVQIQQEDLDTFASNLESAVQAVSAEIDALKLPAADRSKLDAALSDLQALEPPAPTPAPDTPPATS